MAGGGALLATSGCGLRLETDPPAPLPPAPPTVDELARERAAVRAAQLVGLVAAVRGSRPDAARALVPLDADHRAHLAALRVTPSAPSTPTAAATPGPAATVTRLLAAERAAAAAALADVAGTGATTARLLASVAASLQVHVRVLRALPAAAQ